MTSYRIRVTKGSAALGFRHGDVRTITPTRDAHSSVTVGVLEGARESWRLWLPGFYAAAPTFHAGQSVQLFDGCNAKSIVAEVLS